MKIDLKTFTREIEKGDDVAFGHYGNFVIYVAQAGGKAQRDIDDALDNTAPVPKVKKRKASRDDEGDDNGE